MTAFENLSIFEYIQEETKNTLKAYGNQPKLVEEHANIERGVALGGYAGRQLYELVQNSADTLSRAGKGEIWIRLTETHLYCADNGEAIDIDGVTALMFSYMSPKRNTDEIGRFGMGFKSVLGVTDAPEFFSRSGSFRFDRDKSAERIRKAIGPNAAHYPVLRLPEVIDPAGYESEDQILREMRGWATNIVRLPLRDSEAYADLAKQIEDFPSEFLLFVKHVGLMRLQTDNQDDGQMELQTADQTERARVITMSEEESLWVLKDKRDANIKRTSWMIRSKIHRLSSDAKSDSIASDVDEVPIWWAAPLDSSNPTDRSGDSSGKFWTFFPMSTNSLLSGILNAPWKTNVDRTNLLEGTYNNELIDAAADMVADALPSLSKTADPASHLDALPRRHEAGDTVFAHRLRNHLYANLQGMEFVPDQDGKLRTLSDISYPPQGMNPDALGRWAEYEGRPKDWLHHGALTQNRFAKLNEIYKHENQHNELQRKSIRQWLEALRDTLNTEQSIRFLFQKVNPVNDSHAAIRTAAEIFRDRPLTPKELGNIVYTSDGEWQTPDPDKVRLSGDSMYNAGIFVHPDLEWHKKTLASLKTLRLEPVTLETDFRDLAVSVFRQRDRQREWNEGWTNLYELAREIGLSRAADIVRSIESWSKALRVCTVSGTWEPLQDTLLPGPIVPSDGSRDGTVAIDTAGFHKQDVNLLRMLGAIEKPYGGEKFEDRESPIRPYMYKGATPFGVSKIGNNSQTFAQYWKSEFQFRANLPHTPKEELLEIDESTTSGPIYMFEKLSEEGAVLYTWELLDLDDTYNSWIARHTGKNGYGCRTYPPMEFSPARIWLMRCGRIKTDDGEIHPFEDVFGDPPKNKAAHAKLLSHPRGASIRRAFGI